MHLGKVGKGSEGLELLRYIQSVASHRVVSYAWTSDTSVVVEAEALEAGAYNVFYNGVDSAERLELYTKRSQVIKLVRRSAEDDLTGLYNFRTFSYLVKAQMKTARARGRTEVFSLLWIDVDNFKSVNDDHGYLVADELLKIIGVVLREHVRPSDYPCRKSGDEFLVLLPDVDESVAFEVGTKLQREIKKVFVVDNAGKQVSRSISFGIGQIRREEITVDLESSFKKLLNLADLGPKGLKATRQYERR